MARVLPLLEAVLASPITWGVATLVAIALALSGKLSMGAAKWIMWAACCSAAFGVYRAEVVVKLDSLMRFLVLGCCIFGLVAGTVATTRWMSSPKTGESGSGPAGIKLAPAGFISFVGQILNGYAPMMQENQTDKPLDDVRLQITEWTPNADNPDTGRVLWEKQIDIGVVRAKLTKGLDERFPVMGQHKINFDIFILTRLQTYRETIRMTKDNDKQYTVELNFYDGGAKPLYTRTMTLGIANFTRPAPPAAQ